MLIALETCYEAAISLDNSTKTGSNRSKEYHYARCAGILSFMRKKAVDFLMQKARPSILDNRHSSLECLAFYSSCFIFYTGQLTFALRVPGILFIVFHLLYWTTDIRR
ncbi:hypothetical protein M8J76_017366 [Diaphorina citri]|nr:hypothetical protein M8J76_017366 [Diaphorina citri]